MSDDAPQRAGGTRSPRGEGVLTGGLGRLFGGSGFPVFALATIGLYTAAMGALLLLPADAGALGAFADEFRTWCFGQDAATGRMETAAVLLLVVNPVVIALFIFGIWAAPLRTAIRQPSRLALPMALAAAVTTTASALVFAVFGQASAAVPVLELDRIRTAYPLPDAALIDHEGVGFNLTELAGEVTVITSIYVTCPLACPMIMQQVAVVIDALPDDVRDRLSVVVITMNPEEDSVDVLARYIESMRLDRDVYRLATGDPATVDTALDRLGVERRLNEETGQIDHVNLFLIADANGRIAWRFTLGEAQTEHMVDAIQRLVAERPQVAPLPEG